MGKKSQKLKPPFCAGQVGWPDRIEASGFAQFIRHHWHIENRLHWVKDVILKEDETPVCDGNALINFAIVRTLSLNLFRLNGFASITRGLRFLAHDVRKLFSFFQ